MLQAAAIAGWSKAEAPLSITQGFQSPGRDFLFLLLSRQFPVPGDRKCVCLERDSVIVLAVSVPETGPEAVLAAWGSCASLLLFPAL